MIGTLAVTETETTDPRTGEVRQEEMIEGALTTLRFKLRLRLAPMIERRSDKAPDYAVLGNVAGHWAEVGKAWRKMIERGDHAGEAMFSITFEDAEIAASLPSCAAFPAGGREWHIERERPRQPVAA